MKKLSLGLAAVLALAFWVTPGWAKALTGTLEKIEGQFYVLKNEQGGENRVHFDSTTRKTGEPSAGNRVEIDEKNGHARSIKVLVGKNPSNNKQRGAE